MLPWLAPFWLVGVGFFQLRGLAGWIFARRMRRAGVCCAPETWQQHCARLGARLRLSRPVVLLESSLAEVPVVVGWLRPVILLPVGLLAGMPPEQVELILLHELAHVGRYDNLVSLIQTFAEGLLFYHPVVWWISRVMRAERENCCDDLVVTAGGNARDYAVALTALAQSRISYEPAQAATGGSLTRRVRRLLYPADGPRVTLVPILCTAVLALGAATLPAWQSGPAQPAAAPPAFEVASVKPAAPMAASAAGSPRKRATMVRMNAVGRYTNVSLKTLMAMAYGVRPYQVSGPSWLDSERYDIVAKVPEGAQKEQIPAMMQNLLAERFKMTVHRETREGPIYALVVGKNGPKLKKSEDNRSGFTLSSEGHLEVKRTTLDAFSFIVASLFSLDRPVVNMTKIEGNYDITLDAAMQDLASPMKIAPVANPGGNSAEAGPAPEGAPSASIFTAIQKLGLKLEARKAPFEYIVVDKADKVPTEN